MEIYLKKQRTLARSNIVADPNIGLKIPKNNQFKSGVKFKLKSALNF